MVIALVLDVSQELVVVVMGGFLLIVLIANKDLAVKVN